MVFNTRDASMERLYIYRHISHTKSTIHVGKYTSPMDPLIYHTSILWVITSFGGVPLLPYLLNQDR